MTTYIGQKNPAATSVDLGLCLVIGGGGFLGRYIVQMFLQQGRPVRVLGRHHYPALAELGADCWQGDITSEEDTLQACQGVSTVFHTASVSAMWGRKRLLHQVNVEGTANVLKACLQSNVSRLIYTSSPSVAIGQKSIRNGDESLPYPEQYIADYPRSKSQAEKMVLQANSEKLLTCALRPHLLWGPDDPHILPRIREAADKGRLRQIGDGENFVTITHVKNAALGHILAANELAGQARCAGKPYFLGDAEPICLWPWLNQVLEIWGMPPIRGRISWRVARLFAQISEAWHTIMPFLGEPLMTAFVVDQLARSHSFSFAAATRDFAYLPLLSPEEGLETLREASDRQSAR